MLPNSVVRIDAETMEAKQVVRSPMHPDLVVVAGGFVWSRPCSADVNSSALREAGDRTLTRVDPSTGRADSSVEGSHRGVDRRPVR